MSGVQTFDFMGIPHHNKSAGYDICTVQELLGYKDVRTTMFYKHGLIKGALGVRNPLDG
jgi:hypothetical protein